MSSATSNASSRQPDTAVEARAPEQSEAEQTMYNLIAPLPFFAGFKEEQLRLLASCAMRTQLAAGHFILQRGDPANRFYVILQGSVVLSSPDKNGVVHRLLVLGPGDVLGWSWLFPPYYWHFDAVAAEQTDAIFFYGSRLRAECQKKNEFGYELMRRVSEVVISRLQKARQEWIKAIES